MAQLTQNELLQQAQDNLPEEYINAVLELDLTQRVEKIGKRNGLSSNQLDLLDQEVVYLLFNLTSSADFTERLDQGLSLDNQQLQRIIQQTTVGVIQPLQEIIDGEVSNTAAMPVPPPPPAPSAGYGGTSDPYREPTDNR